MPRSTGGSSLEVCVPIVRPFHALRFAADAVPDMGQAIARPYDIVSDAIALLLDPTPACEILAVAADGDVVPQKSTYIYPKATTGLVINPLES